MSNLNEVEEAFATLVAQQAGALLVSGDSTFLTWRERLATLAAHHAVPAIYLYREIVEAGGLMSNAMSMVEGYRTVGAYAARILNGEKPADLPVQQSSKSELVINLKAAKALGIEVPADILVRACRLFDQKRPKHLRLRLAWPLEDLADIRAGTCKQVRLVRRIGHEAIDVREVIMRYIAGIWLSAASATS